VVLVGAQAVYLHAGDTGLSVAVMTTDSDLVLTVHSLAPEPELASVLRAAGFVPGSQPGSWLGEGQVAVDLMVVPHQSNRAKSGARAAFTAPSCTDSRTHHPRPGAGTGRQLSARAPSVGIERRANTNHCRCGSSRLDRREDDQAGRALAQLPARQSQIGFAARTPSTYSACCVQCRTNELVEGFALHRTEPHAERVSAASLHFLADNGRTATNFLSTLAASEMPSDPTVAVSFAALTNDLLDALGL